MFILCADSAAVYTCSIIGIRMWNPHKKRIKSKGMACVGRTKECTIVPSNHYGPIPGVPVRGRAAVERGQLNIASAGGLSDERSVKLEFIVLTLVEFMGAAMMVHTLWTEGMSLLTLEVVAVIFLATKELESTLLIKR
ncbi:unnamed protein product [Ranitomeya imitator]|uniref:Uncharacterized protein n=1 Tax=Ranitomeya imitator TaxID=111125 RepID=A0ABN9KWY1_9NEOB|nr:unnamed protein product [Ranitomeya imitator]